MRLAGRPRVSQCQYYSYRIAYREEPFSPLHYGRKLFQQYVVDVWVRTEANRLNFHKFNQNKLRADRYLGLMDHLEHENVDPGQAQPGRPVILPTTFTAGPRYMKQNYQDAMAMVTKFGKPSLFITYTCNPQHPDIVNNLGNSPNSPHRVRKPLTASDRPDIVAAVFKLHLDQLKNDLKKMFGKKLADIHVIEYQKRGLPHAHNLLWLVADAQIRTADDIDSLISAEIPNPEIDPELYRVVSTCMMHGPCGTANPTAVCMLEGKCSKGFPKEFQEETALNSGGYPLYRRPDNGRTVEKNGIPLDNRFVVPYCPYLSIKYNAHINVEACMSVKSVKYIFKYVYKGYDCARIERRELDPETRDETKTYIDARYVSAPESVWRLSKFDVCNKSHTVVRLDVHLPLEQVVTFREGEDIDQVLERGHVTKLTEWFELNVRDENARQYLYTEIPYHYTWTKEKKWKRRVLNAENNTVSRIYAVSPRDRERFYLRLLLLHVPGQMSFIQLRTYEGVTYETFESACRARGLLIDDTEWDRTLSEAATTASPRQMREIFVTILGYCEPSNPVQLWDDYKNHMSEDFAFLHELNSAVAEQYALQEINNSLLHNFRISVSTFGLSLVSNLPNLSAENNDINVDDEIL